jgi:signal transduction histidine kinase
VRQILVSLLSNAVKFTAAGGEVRISGGTVEHTANAELLGRGPWVYVRVEDSGEGIAAERVSAIFQPYQEARSGESLATPKLSLPISRRLARLMGGDLTVQSEVGVGSEFILSLPMSAAQNVPR